MKIYETERLPDIEYFKSVYLKRQIVLHHTVSATGKYVDDWFKEDKGKSRVAVAYVIDKGGEIYELFNPKYWAYHIGKGSTRANNKRSIGIELVNEGPLFKRGDGTYWWWIDSANPEGKMKYIGPPVELEEEWRGHKYFAPYTTEQMDSLKELIPYLLDEFKINPVYVDHYDYDRSMLDFNGIVKHCNLRSDKTDLSPAFDDSAIEELLLEEIIDIADYELIPYSKPDPIEHLEELPEDKNDDNEFEPKTDILGNDLPSM